VHWESPKQSKQDQDENDWLFARLSIPHWPLLSAWIFRLAAKLRHYRRDIQAVMSESGRCPGMSYFAM